MESSARLKHPNTYLRFFSMFINPYWMIMSMIIMTGTYKSFGCCFC